MGEGNHNNKIEECVYCRIKCTHSRQPSSSIKEKSRTVSKFGLSHHWGDNVSGSWIAHSVEHSPCKRCVPGSSPGLTAHFSNPVLYEFGFSTANQ